MAGPFALKEGTVYGMVVLYPLSMNTFMLGTAGDSFKDIGIK